MKLKSKKGDIFQYLRKSFLVMRITLFFILLSSAFAFSSNSYAQNTKLSLQLNNAIVKDVLKAIENQSEFIFFYQDQQIDLNRKVNIVVEDKNVSEILDQLFAGTANVYIIRDRQITIGKSQKQLESKGLSIGRVLAESQQPQKKEISGTVNDSKGLPLPGVSVVVKGTTIGIITDADGQFKIAVPSDAKTLVFSFVGMKTQEIAITGKTAISVVMEEENIGVDEVVVTALGISREKKSLGYAVSSVSSESLPQAGTLNVLKALDGKITGVNIVSLSSDPTSSAYITIRGATSIAGIAGQNEANISQPLYVIDGVPVGSGALTKLGGVDVGNKLSQLNPSDIASITVLKGASAGALYGSEAGNGVILITTKSGASGAKGIGVSITSSLVFDNVYKTLPVQQDYFQGDRYSSDYYSMEATETWGARAGSAEAAKSYTQWDIKNQKYFDGPLVRTTTEDRIKAFMNVGTTMTNNVSVTGNYDKGNYRLSLTNLKNTNVIPNNATTRNTLSFSGLYKLTDKLSVSSSFSYTRSYTPNKSVVAGRDYASGFMEQLYDMASNMPAMSVWRNANTWINGYEGIYQNTPWMQQKGDPTSRIDGDKVKSNNPYWTVYNNIREFTMNELFAKVEVNYKISDPLNFMLRTGGDINSLVFENRIPYDNKDFAHGDFGASNTQDQRINTDLILTYTKAFGKFDIKANAGYNFRFTNSTSMSFESANLLKPNFFSLSALNTSALNSLSYGGLGTGRYQSIYGTASVGFAKSLFLDVTGRNDWSGITQSEIQHHFYPSASLSWLASETLKLPEWVSLLKLRAGWAQVGYGLGVQQNRNTYGFQGYSWNGASLGTVGGSLVDPHIKPEINESIEYGIETSLFKNRVMFDFTVFQTDHKNQINTIPVVTSTGYPSLTTNVGTVQAKGIEASLTVVPVQNKDWNWSLTGNISTAQSTITYMRDGFSSAWYDYGSNSMQKLAVGEKIGNLWVKDGWFTVQSGSLKGQKLIYQDASGPIEESNVELRTKLGNWNPDYILGLNTTIKYKRFGLTLVGSFRKGGIYHSETQKILIDDGKSPLTISGDHTYWEGGRVGAGGFAWPDPANSLNDAARQNNIDNGVPYNDASYVKGVYVDPRSGADEKDMTLGDKTWTDANGQSHPYYIVQGADPNSTLYKDPYSVNGGRWDKPQTRTFDATNFKLKEVIVSYSLPSTFTRKFKCQGGTFSLVGKNLWFWTKSGFNEDPESAFTGAGNTQGLARFIMPSVRSMGFELNLNF